MQLFVTDVDPVLAARALDDRRVVNQARETAQLLAAALRRHGVKRPPVGAAYANSPVARWVGETHGNYDWALLHLQGLVSEYAHRYGKAHHSANYVAYFTSEMKRVPVGERAPFVNAAGNTRLGVDFTSLEDVVVAYREYLFARWATARSPVAWTRRRPPRWLRTRLVRVAGVAFVHDSERDRTHLRI